MVSSINIVRKQSHLSLVHLDMSECSSLDDTGLNMIVLNCPQMTQLYLRKCSNITRFAVGLSQVFGDDKNAARPVSILTVYFNILDTIL